MTADELNTQYYLRRLVDYHRIKRMILDAAMVAARISPYEELPSEVEEELRIGVEDVISDAFSCLEADLKDKIIEIGLVDSDGIKAHVAREGREYDAGR